jgi:5-formyltetrahydrofolate cyclo-ligase
MSQGDAFRSQGLEASACLSSSPVWPRYKTVFLFLSVNTEIDTRPLLEAALKAGKKVFSPVVEGGGLVFYAVRSPDGPWRGGAYGIREPAAPAGGDRATGGDFPALVVTPGLAFDGEGNRLGRGRGFYDRFFAETDAGGRRCFALGFCMDFQLLGKVPAGDNDRKMDGLVAGKECIIFTG